MILSPQDPDYPRRLFEIEEPPVITVSGPLSPPPLAVAIVGSRNADRGTAGWAHLLAYLLAKAGVVVVSGGAVGVDQAAHRGAMKVGATWCVACTGAEAPAFPRPNEDLFRAIAASETSRMIWPFPPKTRKSVQTPRLRNRVLVALAHAVVVIQARAQSGSINAASNAERMSRPLYVATGQPWDPAFHGSRELIANQKGFPLVATEQLFHELGLPRPDVTDPEASMWGELPLPVPIRTFKRRGPSFAPTPLFDRVSMVLTSEENAVKSSLSRAPTHQDKIVEATGLSSSVTLTALLTLALKDVVVEGPDGFFRLQTEA